ncbi:MAG: type 1 pili tip component [Sulfuriferula sp.]
MMRIADLVKEWEVSATDHLTAKEYRIRLPLHDAAKIAALKDMYPLRSTAEIIAELLTAALNELERAMPYVQGNKVIARDEQGDAIFEDVGPTSRFNILSKQYMAELEKSGKLHSK